MPDQAEIIVKRGAQLIVDGGTITSAGQKWLGIKTKGKKNRLQRFLGKKGEVIFKNGAVIEKNLK